MIHRWLVLDYVPAGLPLDRAARRKVRARSYQLSQSRAIAKRHQSRDPRARFRKNALNLIYALIPATIQAGIMVVFFAMDLAALWSWLAIVPLLIAQILFTWIMMAVLGRIVWKPYMLLALREQGYELCTNCEYWLRDLPAEVTHCPECGAERMGDDAALSAAGEPMNPR